VVARAQLSPRPAYASGRQCPDAMTYHHCDTAAAHENRKHRTRRNFGRRRWNWSRQGAHRRSSRASSSRLHRHPTAKAGMAAPAGMKHVFVKAKQLGPVPDKDTCVIFTVFRFHQSSSQSRDQVTTVGAFLPVRTAMSATRPAMAIRPASAVCVGMSCFELSASYRSR
jgi:hypothetical protein